MRRLIALTLLSLWSLNATAKNAAPPVQNTTQVHKDQRVVGAERVSVPDGTATGSAPKAATSPAQVPAGIVTDSAPQAAVPPTQVIQAPEVPRVLIKSVAYTGRLTAEAARFDVAMEIESAGSGCTNLPLFEGNVAVPAPSLPSGLALVRDGSRYSLAVSDEGRFSFTLALIAKVTRSDPWYQISFSGPADAALASLDAEAAGAGTEIEMLAGTARESGSRAGGAFLRGFLGPERAVSLRWRSRAAEAARQTLLTCTTLAAAHVTPTVVKFTTELRLDVLQGSLARLPVILPSSHALTRLQGAHVRDWQVASEGAQQVLTVEFITPVEKSAVLTLFSEQTLDAMPAKIPLSVPQPRGVERESGAFRVTAEDVTVEVESSAGLRQTDAGTAALAAYQFYARPFNLVAALRRIDPVIRVSDRLTLRMEEARLLTAHVLSVNVEKAGVYTADVALPTNVIVTDVASEGLEEWKPSGNKLALSFSRRLLGAHQVTILLEQALKSFPDRVDVAPVRWLGAERENVEIGVAPSPGIQLRTKEVVGAREIPSAELGNRRDELLAFRSEKPEWSVTLSCERLAPRLIADVFNLITVGDGLVGGSATIRYAILNQGVQEFRVRLPAHWKNVEFIGPSIRRKEQKEQEWTITLQEKAWGGYTLVATYDFQFDPQQATLSLGGAHAVGVERESGTVAVGTVPSLRLKEKSLAAVAPAQVFRIDEADMPAADRALSTRPILTAYRYSGDAYTVEMDVTRFAQVSVLQAVADLTQLSTVLTQEGQLLTQASFMIKNSEKQFQRFRMPEGAEFWGGYADGQAVKPERDGQEILVPLPRGTDRDEAHPVEIVYAQTIKPLSGKLSRRIALMAPRTDIQTTFAEWELYVPATHVLAGFGGNMSVARGARYGIREAWNQFVRFYDRLYVELRPLAILVLVAAGFIALLVLAVRRKWKGVLALLCVGFVLLLLAGMILPAMSSARERARLSSSMSNLRQVGAGILAYAADHQQALPPSLGDLSGTLAGGDKLLTDPSSGGQYEYVAAGRKLNELGSDAIIAFAPSSREGGRNVLLANGSVQWMNEGDFSSALSRSSAITVETLAAEALPESSEVAGKEQSKAEKKPGDKSDREIEVQVSTAPAEAPSAAPSRPASPRSANFDSVAIVKSPVVMRGFYAGRAGGGAVGAGTVAGPQGTAGVRSLRIDVPREGTRYLFTKVLDVRGEPLVIKAWAWKATTRTAMQGLLMLVAFLAGIGLLWTNARRSEPHSLRAAVGLALVAGSLGAVLVISRLLGAAMIAAPPLVAVWLVLWLIRAAWRRRRARRALLTTPQVPPPMPGGPPTGPATAVAMLLVGLLSASAARSAPEGGLVIRSAEYDGAVLEKVAEIAVTLDVSTEAMTGRETAMALFGSDVAVSGFSAPRHATLVRSGGTVALQLSRRRDARVSLRLLVKLGGDAARRTLAFGMPPALSSRLVLTVPEAEAQVDVPGAVSVTQSRAGEGAAGGSRVEAVFGAAERIEVQWLPRVKRAAETAATVFCQNDTLVSVGSGAVNTRSILGYQITQGELRECRVLVPAGQRLLRVGGEGIRTWNLEPGTNGDVLAVELLAGATTNWQFTVETERPLDSLPADVSVAIPHAQDVKRETGRVALTAGEELGLSVARSDNAQKVDAEEFLPAARHLAPAVFGPAAAKAAAGERKPEAVFRFLRPDFMLAVRVESLRPRIEAVVYNHLRVALEHLTLWSRTDYTIKRVGVFSFSLAIPPGYAVTRVGGEKIADWSEKTEGGVRTLTVRLSERAIGDYSLSVDLYRWLQPLPPSVDAQGVYPLDTQKITGFVKVGTDLGVQAKVGSLAGLVEVPAASVADLGAGGGVLAYKFVQESPGRVAPWKLAVATEVVEAWVRAEVVNWLGLSSTELGLVRGRSVIRYEIQNAPVGEFRFQVPADFRNVEITGESIRRRDQQGDTWRVELQSKVSGQYLLTVTWDRPFSVEAGEFEAAGVRPLAIERETGAFALQASPPLQVVEKAAGGDLVRVDARELPDWAGQAGPNTVLAYRYLRPGQQLVAGVQRFKEAEVLNALVESAQLTTVVAEDGQAMTEMSLQIRNTARQYLEATLPKDAELWSAFVDGQAVRPSVREGRVLVPLERLQAGAAPARVELLYVSNVRFPPRRGTLDLVSPALDAPLKSARWELFLPADYRYGDFAGSMTYEPDAAPQRQVYAFSMGEYVASEGRKKAARVAQVKAKLEQAKTELDRDNVKDFNAAYQQVIANAPVEEQKSDEVKNLESKWRKVQARNVLSGQRQLAVGYAKVQAQAGAQQAAQQVGAPARAEDEEVAAQQWDRVQQAQEIAVAKVRPLRVNLPARGVRYGFTQALQTEIDKPMTIRLDAVNARGISVPLAATLGAGGFLALWILAAMAISRRAAGSG